jgi:hypothetical protein
LGANALEKSSEIISNIASIFPMCLRSNILRHLTISYLGFRVKQLARFAGGAFSTLAQQIQPPNC